MLQQKEMLRNRCKYFKIMNEVFETTNQSYILLFILVHCAPGQRWQYEKKSKYSDAESGEIWAICKFLIF